MKKFKVLVFNFETGRHEEFVVRATSEDDACGQFWELWSGQEVCGVWEV